MTLARKPWILVIGAAAALMAVPLPAGAAITWNVSGGGNWDTNTANWTGDSTNFTDNGTVAVIFNNTAGGTITIAPNMSPLSTTVSAASGAYTFTGGPIDSGSLAKSGGGTLILAGTNTYAGGTSITAGTLQANTHNALPIGTALTILGNSTLNLNGYDATLGSIWFFADVGYTSHITTGSGTLTLNGNVGTDNNARGTNLISGKLDFGGGVRGVTPGDPGNGARPVVIIAATISNGGLTVGGGNPANMTILIGTNTYTGTTTVNGGTLRVGDGTSGHDGVIAGTSIVNNAAMGYNLFGSQVYTGVISGSGSLTKLGPGTLILSGTNTYAGSTTMSAGILSAETIGNGGVAGNLGRASSWEGNLVFDGGTLRYTGATAVLDRNFTINAGKTAGFDIATNTLTLPGCPSTTGGLTKTGAGTLAFSSAAAYSGATTVSNGTLALGASGSLAGTNFAIAAGGALDVTAKGTYTMAASHAYTFGVDPAGAGSAGRIEADGLDISHAYVTIAAQGTLNDLIYVLATYTSLSGESFAGVIDLPEKYSLRYNYHGNQIVLMGPARGTVMVVR